MAKSDIHHESTICPKCGKGSVPVYEVDVPPPLFVPGRTMGALHLAHHACPKGGDHMRVQEMIQL